MNGIKIDPDIKSDPDSPPGSGYMDDDFYEDTKRIEVLEQRDRDAPGGAERLARLARGEGLRQPGELAHRRHLLQHFQVVLAGRLSQVKEDVLGEAGHHHGGAVQLP